MASPPRQHASQEPLALVGLSSSPSPSPSPSPSSPSAPDTAPNTTNSNQMPPTSHHLPSSDQEHSTATAPVTVSSARPLSIPANDRHSSSYSYYYDDDDDSESDSESDTVSAPSEADPPQQQPPPPLNPSLATRHLPQSPAAPIPEHQQPSAHPTTARQIRPFSASQPSQPILRHNLPTTNPNLHTRSQTVDLVANHPATRSPSTSTASPSSAASTVWSAPIRRKPLSSTASPLATRFSQASSVRTIDLPKPDQRFSRSCSIDSPTLYDFPKHQATSQPLNQANPPGKEAAANLASLDAASPESRNIPVSGEHQDAGDFTDVVSGYDDLISDLAQDEDYHDIHPQEYHDPLDSATQHPLDDASTYSDDTPTADSPAPPMLSQKPTPPHLNLQTRDNPISRGNQLDVSPSEQSGQKLNKPLPKSPGPASPFASIFGWGNSSPAATEYSTIPSPSSPDKTARGNDIHEANGNTANAASANALGYCESYLSTPPPSISASSNQVEEMEEELKAISSELAGSIRREMDLEDLVDRLQEQINNPHAPGKRTSDYFSDSGYSSTKQSDYDAGKEEVEKIQRRSEQEKASLRLELTGKLQDERSRRQVLDQQIKELAEKASQVDLAHMNSVDANGRLRDLEKACEDLRRKLSEERDSKINFEDLLGALKSELQDACNERDNLRDEIVPQLRARVEGLETEAAEYSNLTYESTKMQQELQTLKSENMALRGGEELPTRSSRAMSGGLSRSNSVAAGALRNQRNPNMGLSRSSSVKGTQLESREALAERLKDVEAQRDALHRALKSLLDRQEFQSRENQKKIKVLEGERQRLLSGNSRKAGFEKDISNLRTEINVLRRRAEDALEQKWQVEKGLGGLKMDLDKAEEEIASLRSLLQENDILIPPTMARSSDSHTDAAPVTSESLQRAYNELQANYKESLERIKKLEIGTASGSGDKRTRLAVQRLEVSLSSAIVERDAARQQAESLRQQYESLCASEAQNIKSELDIADELTESAHQVEQLASQVRQQLSTNSELRQRLSDAVSRGDMDRQANSDRISGLQDRLRALEELLVAAQSASEDRVTRHEDEIADLRDAHNNHLLRVGGSPGLNGLRAPALKSGTKTQAGAGQSAAFGNRAPRIDPPKSFEDETQMKLLRTRVAELEKALTDTENEMQEVVAKMSAAQIEVMNLQEERETAVRETRKLQKALEQEYGKSFEQRFKTLAA